ncbi:MAG: prohead protease/major capsid protein fusion protein [Bacteroidota bacterium]
MKTHTSPGALLTRSAGQSVIPQAERRDMTLQIRAEPISKTAMNAESRTIDVVWSTGVGVKRYDYENDCYYQEELSLDAGHVRLARLNSIGKVLDSHQAWSGVRSILGKVEAGSAKTDGKVGTAQITLGRTADIDPVWERLDQGLITHVSVGYRVYKYEVTRKDGQLPVYRAVDWEPVEISLVAMPADPDAAVLRSEHAEKYPCEIVSSGAAAQHEDNSDMKTRSSGGGAPQPQVPPAITVEANADLTRQQPPPPPPAPSADQTRQQPPPSAQGHNTDTAIGRAEALQQMTQIRDLVGAAGIQGADAERMASDFFQRGVTLEGVRSALFEHVTGRSVVQGITGTQTLRIQQGRSGDDPEFKRHAMSHAIALRFLNANEVASLERHLGKDMDADQLKAVVENARSYNSFSILDMASELLEARGDRQPRGDRNKLALRAMETADFPILLAAAADKILLPKYQIQEVTYTQIASQRDLNDFKAKNLVRKGDFPAFERKMENGEFKRGSFGESKEVAKLESVGVELTITREALINDDLGVLADFSDGVATAAAAYENGKVWSLVTSNAKLFSDNKALFHADHGNLADAGNYIGSETVGEGRRAVRTQKNDKGRQLNTKVKLLVVPAALETKADQFTNPYVFPATGETSVPESLRQLQVVTEALLDADSEISWYLFADPMLLPCINYGWLSGSQGPQTYYETKPGRGIEFLAFEDFHASLVDYRGAYKNPGKA